MHNSHTMSPTKEWPHYHPPYFFHSKNCITWTNAKNIRKNTGTLTIMPNDQGLYPRSPLNPQVIKALWGWMTAREQLEILEKVILRYAQLGHCFFLSSEMTKRYHSEEWLASKIKANSTLLCGVQNEEASWLPLWTNRTWKIYNSPPFHWAQIVRLRGQANLISQHTVI